MALCFWLVAAFPTAQAQTARTPTVPAAPATREQADETLIATLTANGVERGEFTLLRKPDGDFWIGADDLASLKLVADSQARRQLGSGAYYSLRALGASSLLFDEATLTLQVDFPVDALGQTRIDLANRPVPIPVSGTPNSLILSYRLSARPGFQGASSEGRLDNDLNVRVGSVLLRQETRLDMVAGQRRFSRGVSQAIWDDPVGARRLVVGDLLSSGGAFGSTITGAGLLLTKLYDLTPDQVRQPTATLRAIATSPSEVEVAVDGTTLYRSRVGPGPISLENLLLYGGSRTVRVTVTDSSGRREVTEQPFLFTDQALARGLHEYSYFIGKRSRIDTQNRFDYLEPAWQGYHRYGVSDYLTLSAGGEGNRTFANAGVGATVRSDTLGLLSVEALESRDHASTATAQGWSGRYTYLLPEASFLLARRHYGNGFRSFGTSAFNPFLRDELRAGVSARVFASTVSLDFARTSDTLETRLARTLRVSTNLSRGVTLAAEAQSSRSATRRDHSLYVFLRMALDGQRWISSIARNVSGSRGLDLEAGQQVGQGEGVGYRVGASADRRDGESTGRAFGSVLWNLRPATLEASVSAPVGGGGGTYAEMALSGSVLAVDGQWGLSRQVSEGFVLARLGVPQPGVQVYLNNQSQGRTGADGQLLIPGVGPYGRQDVSLDDRDLGMQYDIEAKRRTIALPYRGGLVVNFGARKLSAISGMAWLSVAGQRAPIASRSWTLAGPQAGLQVETSRTGDFYLEDAPAGRYSGKLEANGRTYACRLTVPEFAEAVFEVKEGIVCE